MAKRIQFRRGTSTQHSSFTGALGEVTVDTTLKTLRVHDNVKVGGNIIATTEDLVSKITQVSTVADLQNTEPMYIGQIVYVLEYGEGTGYGGGLYIAVENTYTGSDSEETLGGSRWRMITENNIFPIDRLGAVKDNSVSVKDAFIRAIKCVREAGSGTVYVGPGEWTMAQLVCDVNASNITFHFELGCHIKMANVLLGWYPTSKGKGHHNVSIVGEGIIETLPGAYWHNDLVYVTGVKLEGLTFIRPLVVGHFLDLMGCADVCIENITVLGSNIESHDGNGRFYVEFIQVSEDATVGLGWVEKRTELVPLMNQGIGTINVTLTNSVFLPYTDKDNVTTYPPRPIGNHSTQSGDRNLRIIGNKFKDIIRQEISPWFAWLEIPTADEVHISGNSFICTGASIPLSDMQVGIIMLRGASSSRGVAILDNTFDITVPDGKYTSVISNVSSGLDINITGNVFKCAAEFSDLVSLSAPCNIKVLGNSVDSTGRRFFFGSASSAGSRCLVQGNNLIFNPPPTVANYRDPVDVSSSSLTLVGNHIEHPSKAFNVKSNNSVCTAVGNTMVGGAREVSLNYGMLTGNLFKTATAPVVTIGGVAQTSNGWNFVHVPV